MGNHWYSHLIGSLLMAGFIDMLSNFEWWLIMVWMIHRGRLCYFGRRGRLSIRFGWGWWVPCLFLTTDLMMRTGSFDIVTIAWLLIIWVIPDNCQDLDGTSTIDRYSSFSAPIFTSSLPWGLIFRSRVRQLLFVICRFSRFYSILWMNLLWISLFGSLATW